MMTITILFSQHVSVEPIRTLSSTTLLLLLENQHLIRYQQLRHTMTLKDTKETPFLIKVKMVLMRKSTALTNSLLEDQEHQEDQHLVLEQISREVS